MSSPQPSLEKNANPENWLPLLELACREVFEIMLGCKLEPFQGTPPRPEFTAIVGLAGRMCGVLSLRCTAQSATLMASKMLGVSIQQADEHMWDALGEVCNMIAGNFKNKLAGMAESCMLSVPTVITGADYSFRSLTNSGQLETLFLFEGEVVGISLETHN